jgi:hypothetical protein
MGEVIYLEEWKSHPQTIIKEGKRYFSEKYTSRFLELPEAALRRMGFDTITHRGMTYYCKESIHEFMVELGICLE